MIRLTRWKRGVLPASSQLSTSNSFGSGSSVSVLALDGILGVPDSAPVQDHDSEGSIAPTEVDSLSCPSDADANPADIPCESMLVDESKPEAEAGGVGNLGGVARTAPCDPKDVSKPCCSSPDAVITIDASPSCTQAATKKTVRSIPPNSSAYPVQEAPRGTRNSRPELFDVRRRGVDSGAGLVAPPKKRGQRLGGFVELRQERKRRDAEFRLGDLKAKPPIIHIQQSAQVAGTESCQWHALDICRPALPSAEALRVLLPLRATESQHAVAKSACDAMDVGGCAFLEAPTGTGKTMAVLGTALAWQWEAVEAKKTWEASHAQRATRQLNASDSTPSPPRVPRVLWVARTHEQLLHAQREFRRLPYRPMMSLRLSRERFCLHPNVRTARNKAEACEIATTILPQKGAPGKGKAKGKAPQPSGCSYLEHAEAIRYPQSSENLRRYQLGGPLETYDIEDLVREAEALHICPFHTVGDLSMEGAGLVFLTYNQLLDPLVRFAGGYEPLLQDAIVAVDEAHNLAAEAREVASFSASAEQLEQMRCHFEGLAQHMPDSNCQKIAIRLVTAVAKLRSWLLEAASCPPGTGSSGLRVLDGRPSGPNVAGGIDCLSLVRRCGLESAKQVDRDIRDLKRLRKDLMWAGLESTAVRSAAVNELEAFLWKMRFILDGGSEDYRLVVDSGPQVQFICLRGAVALEPAVRPTHSLLLFSGTLSPFDLLAQELGIQTNADRSKGSMTNESQVSDHGLVRSPRALYTCLAPHHENIAQMCLARAIGSIDKVVLDSRLRCRNDAYLRAVGKAVQELCSSIPNGTVVFLPSYALLDALVANLRMSGVYAALAAVRRVFVERRGDSEGEVLAAYRAAAIKGSAILLAVMRGRAAEGVDLRDAEARGCIIVGVPFPMLSIEVELRRQAPGGARWYEAEAMRQVSQAAGRLLRHKHDFGALVLLDTRYATGRPSALLAAWLRGLLRPASVEGSVGDLKAFFSLAR